MLIEQRNDEFGARHMFAVLAVVAVLVLSGIFQMTGWPAVGEAQAAPVSYAAPVTGPDGS